MEDSTNKILSTRLEKVNEAQYELECQLFQFKSCLLDNREGLRQELEGHSWYASLIKAIEEMIAA